METITDGTVKESARERAYRILKNSIIMLELEPGTMVSESDLAAKIGVSRTPVREALMELGKTKIVEIIPQKGSFISNIDYDLVEESRFMRLVLEMAVVEIACESAVDEDLLELEENLVMQDFCISSFNSDKLMELDNQFHKKIFCIANKLQTYNMLSAMSVHFDRVRKMSLDTVENTVKDIKIVADHQAILKAMREKDKAAAKQHMEKHLSRCRIDEQRIREKYPGYFK
ncbi:MAG: GntR family transcriptional regulator [Clostridiales Family XIII bacterium]|jgi:DNA-binding GntR family transcriptional regulator|nr:GntR family transcriptional regulator [Clostridiales Family XIII bacterium]